MHISHIALWTKDLEHMKGFYQQYFGASVGKLYVNHAKKFRSYFLTFDNDCRLELMHQESESKEPARKKAIPAGFAHIAMSVGSKDKVNELTEMFRKEGVKIFSEPRITGDGFYEAVILDPEGNLVEITA